MAGFGSKTAVDHVAHKAFSGTAMDHAADIGMAVEALGASIPAQLDACWEGAAKDKFALRLAAFAEDLGRYMQDYKALIERLQDVGARYEAADASALGQVAAARVQAAL